LSVTYRYPPGPTDHPLKQLSRFSNDVTAFYLDMASEYGPVFTLHVFGQEPWVIVGDPLLVREIFATPTDDLINASEGVKFLLGSQSMLFMEGDAHKQERRVMLPHFHHGKMQRYAARMLESADSAIDDLVAGSELRANDAMVKVTLRTIVECVFGVTEVAKRKRLERLLAADLELTQQAIWFVISMTMGGTRTRRFIDQLAKMGDGRYRADDPPLPSFKVKRFMDVKAEIGAILDDEIARARRESSTGREDMLALLEASVYPDGSRMEDGHLFDELMTLLIGGHDTTSITMAWALYFVGQNPTIRDKALEELDRVFGDGPVTVERLDDLKYLGAILDETMRIKPLAATVPRRFRDAKQLGEWSLPPGANIFPSPIVVHLRPDLWPEPHAFKPERFFEKVEPFTFLPFGGGGRTCAGRTFANTQMRLVLAQWLRRVDYRIAPSADPKMLLKGILMGPSDGVPIVIDAVRPRGQGRSGARKGGRAETSSRA
jgi:cytochrome P450